MQADDSNIPAVDVQSSALFLTESSDFRAFGTTIRTIVDPGRAGSGTARAVRLLDSAPASETPSAFHMHGGSIEVNVPPGVDLTAVAVDAVGNAIVHTPGTAFGVSSPPDAFFGVPTRLAAGGGVVLSPFLWAASSTPPASTSETSEFNSLDGQDIFVETDCDSAGDCAGGGIETHLMIYNETECDVTNPWFDIVTAACRLPQP